VIEQGNILKEKDIKLKIIGDKTKLSKDLQKEIKKAEKNTENCKKGLLNICINYGGREEVIFAINTLLKEKKGKITEKGFKKYLRLGDIPDPDLIIRTSGEQRLSGFLTWQSVYSEFFFVKKHWPAFLPKDLDIVIKEFNKRNRRFGAN